MPFEKFEQILHPDTIMADQAEADQRFMRVALDEARKGFNEGGIPIGAVLVSSTGAILGQGHNLRIQNSSPILHAEISALQSAGRLPAASYKGATMYTTLSPCTMCTGAILLYGIKRVVMGENNTYVGGEDWLENKGVEVVNLKDEECEGLLKRFIEERGGEWGEDIGEER